MLAIKNSSAILFCMQVTSILLFSAVGLVTVVTLFIAFVLLKRGIYQINIRLQERERSTNELRDSIVEHQLKSLKVIQESIQTSMADIRSQVMSTLNNNTDSLTKRVEKLTETTDLRLKEISGQVEKRLSEGFEKTTNIFADVVKRLALIDAAQKKITELSGRVSYK